MNIPEYHFFVLNWIDFLLLPIVHDFAYKYGRQHIKDYISGYNIYHDVSLQLTDSRV